MAVLEGAALWVVVQGWSDHANPVMLATSMQVAKNLAQAQAENEIEWIDTPHDAVSGLDSIGIESGLNILFLFKVDVHS